MKRTTYCPVCGDAKSFIGQSPKRFEYCSKKCVSKKPPKVLETEAEWGMPIDQILIETTKTFGSVSAQEAAIGIKRPTLYAWTRKYCGVSFSALVSEYGSISRRGRYKKGKVLGRPRSFPRTPVKRIPRTSSIFRASIHREEGIETEGTRTARRPQFTRQSKHN